MSAGIDGVLQRIGGERPLQVGQQVNAGTAIALVANPAKLKAEIKIAETQARDLTIGQIASVDTRNGIIPGKVIRIDPAAQTTTSSGSENELTVPITALCAGSGPCSNV